MHLRGSVVVDLRGTDGYGEMLARNESIVEWLCRAVGAGCCRKAVHSASRSQLGTANGRTMVIGWAANLDTCQGGS